MVDSSDTPIGLKWVLITNNKEPRVRPVHRDIGDVGPIRAMQAEPSADRKLTEESSTVLPVRAQFTVNPSGRFSEATAKMKSLRADQSSWSRVAARAKGTLFVQACKKFAFPSTSLSVEVESISTVRANPDDLYRSAVEQYGRSLGRLAGAYEADPERRRDLSQDIHFQLWRSFHHYDGRCSVRTWTYRVAHHVAASYVIRERRTFSKLVSLEELEALPDKDGSQLAGEQRINLARLYSLIQHLRPLDRQVIVCWLEGMNAESIGEITGLEVVKNSNISLAKCCCISKLSA